MASKSKRVTQLPLHLEDYELDNPVLSAQKSTPRLKQESRSSTASVQEQLELERLKNENLKLELQIKQTELEVAKLGLQNGTPKAVAAAEHRPIQELPFLQESPVTNSEDLLKDLQFPSLTDLRQKQKTKSFLPNQYLFTSKGNIDFDKLDISEFVVGFLEMIHTIQSTQLSAQMLHVLKLLMEKATTYTWNSVKNFYLALATAFEQKRFMWSDTDIIHNKASTFFTHADLRPTKSTSTSQQVYNNPAKSRSKDSPRSNFCRDWNYKASCSCDKTESTFKDVHKCRVCESDHPMLYCKKRRFPIPDATTVSTSTA